MPAIVIVASQARPHYHPSIPHQAKRMATPTPPSPPPRPSAASRYLFVLLLGLLVGVIAVVMVLRAIDARRTWEDRFPGAVMHVMSAHAAQVGASIEANRCAASDIVPHVQTQRALANDLEPAFAGLREDQRFTAHASKLRADLDAVLASPPQGCAAARAALKQVNDACRACHQDFRG